MATIFVYGTLKKGGCNNFLLKNDEFLREVVTRPIYRLYDNGSYPMLIEDSKSGKAIQGELWSVSKATVARLDRLEGVPHLYQRKNIEIDGESDCIEGYVYQRSVSHYQECSPVWP